MRIYQKWYLFFIKQLQSNNFELLQFRGIKGSIGLRSHLQREKNSTGRFFSYVGAGLGKFFLDLDAGCQKNNALAFILKHLDPDMFLNAC